MRAATNAVPGPRVNVPLRLGRRHAASRELDVVVDAGHIVEVGSAAEAAHFGVGDGVADAFDAGHQQGAGAHRAGLLGHVDGGAGEPPGAELGGGLGDGEHLGVGGRVLAAFDGVVGGADDFAADFDDCADGDFVLAPRVDGLIIGQAHEKGVVADELRGEAFFERAGRRRGGQIGHGGGRGRAWAEGNLD
jgi:hypothetical protein